MKKVKEFYKKHKREIRRVVTITVYGAVCYVAGCLVYKRCVDKELGSGFFVKDGNIADVLRSAANRGCEMQICTGYTDNLAEAKTISEIIEISKDVMPDIDSVKFTQFIAMTPVK